MHQRNRKTYREKNSFTKKFFEGITNENLHTEIAVELTFSKLKLLN